MSETATAATAAAVAELSGLAQTIGHEFGRPELLLQAVTHKSFRNEQTSSLTFNNERLEYLGDAVLDLAMSDLLMRTFPEASEGSLSKRRASLVNEETLAAMARTIKLDECLRVGRGERASGGMQKPRLLASALEAVFGAIFVDAGFAPALQATERLFRLPISQIEIGQDFLTDYKSRLQEFAQEHFRVTPSYVVVREQGPDHDKEFEVEVSVGDQEKSSGIGKSKKAAEQSAAKLALERLQ